MINTGVGRDIILGGVDGDTIVANDGEDVAADILDNDNIVIGDSGYIDWTAAEHGYIPGLPGDDNDPQDIDRISTTDPSVGGDDNITTGSGFDLIFGGAADDKVFAGAGNDLVFGDHGKTEASGQDGGVIASALPLATLMPLFTFTAIDTLNDLGGEDTIFGQEGEDILLGQQESDTIFGGDDDDDIFGGHNVADGHDAGDFLDGGSGNDVVVGDNASVLRRGDSRSPRMRILGGDVIYDADDVAQVTADAQLNPTNAAERDIELFNHEDGLLEPTFGDDYIAGGAHDDVILSQLGNDVVQGDGSIDSALAVLEISPASESGTPHHLTTLSGDYREFDGSLETVVSSDDDTITIAGHGFANGQLVQYAGGTSDVGGLSDGAVYAIAFVDGDTIQLMRPVAAARDIGGFLWVSPSFEATSDGDDYIEGNGGDDIVFGNLGQDDIVGGSSTLFGLTDASLPNDEVLRPDGEDLIFGGAGGVDDSDGVNELARNNMGDESSAGHARDADVIAGDNANILRLVEIIDDAPETTAFISFNYDTYDPMLEIIPRAVELIDYTTGGPDYDPAAMEDNGAADEIHGESGDDQAYGMVGDDVLFGEGQDDDLIGGWGNDWISGGTGIDGVLGDDGRIYTSRNVEGNTSHMSEPLYGIYMVDVDPNSDSKEISTPGNVQLSQINVLGELKKTVNLTPFNVDPDGDPLFRPAYADDIIFGGWNDDFLHGGSGDDAMSGAEALAQAAAQIPDPQDENMVTRIVIGYDTPSNPGNVLGFERYAVSEFALYSEFLPRHKIYVDPSGEAIEIPAAAGHDGIDFLLNFSAAQNDGNDVLFGDLGNDWIVGGTGRDNSYGGYGDDLLNADDNMDTNGGLNDIPDAMDPSQEDIAFGGAGRDVLMANNDADHGTNAGGDRLIDFSGEFNTYLVPFAEFGPPTISRAVQPGLFDYLYELSASDGADPTRFGDTGSGEFRNGEPEGEIGLVTSADFDWQAQTGAPDDMQPGNIPGGGREQLQTANFNNGDLNAFAVDSGVFAIEGGRLEVSPQVLGSDAAAVFYVDHALPTYFEMQATINGGRPLAGLKSNAYIIFDYQSPTDFKFAGANISVDKLQMGHRDADGWHVDVQTPAQLRPDTDYNMLLAINGVTATLVLDNQDVFTHTFEPRIDRYGMSHGINAGLLGVGSDNSMARIDNVTAQVLPPEITYEQTDDFTDGTADLFVPETGQWLVEPSGRYTATPAMGEDRATSVYDLSISATSILQLETMLSTQNTGGFIFDQKGPENFKFVAISVNSNQVIIGHHTSRHGWAVDAAADVAVAAGQDYELKASLKGRTVSIDLDGQVVLGHAFNALVVDGGFGLLSRDASSSFDSVTVSTDDLAYDNPPAAGDVPTITALAVNPDPVTQGENVALTATGVADTDGTVDSVAFYRDANGNGSLDVGLDTLLGTDTTAGDGWTVTVPTSGFAVGTQTYFAVATDNDGLTSNPMSGIGEVASGGSGTTTYASTDTPISLPDENTVISTLEISDDATIHDLNVQLNIAHTRDADLDVYLISPVGTRVELFTDVGGSGDDFQDTIFDDESGIPITSGSAPFAGTYRPEGNLAEFEGESLAGTWQLEIHDDRSRQTGTLNSWSIIAEHSPIAAAASANDDVQLAPLLAAFPVAEPDDEFNSDTENDLPVSSFLKVNDEVVLVEGDSGLFTRSGSNDLSNVTVSRNDTAHRFEDARLLLANYQPERTRRDAIALDAAATSAIDRWLATGTVDTDTVNDLFSAKTDVASLPGQAMRMIQNHTSYVDVAVVSPRWYVDSTLAGLVGAEDWIGQMRSAAHDRFTVSFNESRLLSGHELDGFGDNLTTRLRVEPNIRRRPTIQGVDAVLAVEHRFDEADWSTRQKLVADKLADNRSNDVDVLAALDDYLSESEEK